MQTPMDNVAPPQQNNWKNEVQVEKIGGSFKFSERSILAHDVSEIELELEDTQQLIENRPQFMGLFFAHFFKDVQ